MAGKRTSADTDVVRRMLSSAKAARYDLTVTVYETTSARQAYLLECRSTNTILSTTRFIPPFRVVGIGVARTAIAIGPKPSREQKANLAI
jgi:hypothetical protein